MFNQAHVKMIFAFQDCLRSIVRQSLKHLRTNDISSLEDSLTSLKGPLKFQFPISSAHVKEQLAK